MADKTTKLLSASIHDLGELGVALVIEERIIPESKAPVGRGKYLQAAREMSTAETRKAMLYIADCYPDLFKTILTVVLKR
jgi:hypothetical protein